MTRRDRLEARVERRRGWAAGRQRQATAAFKAASTIADGIPLGQPILVGHHSEAHARRDAARIDSGMRRGIENRGMAAYHESKADNLEHALAHTIFSDDEDAPDRLKARIAELDAKRERYKALNKQARADGKETLPAYVLTNLSANIRRLQKRLEGLGG